MATVTLTARHPDQRKPQRQRYEVFDTLVPGFAVRLSPSGHKTFTLYYRHLGRMRRVGLGRYPDVIARDSDAGPPCRAPSTSIADRSRR
jgi:hypothetical protein